ncbi:MAG: anaerobic ribonucleoside-triphosphate reductase activating protein [Ruminococcaceae bacterium]|nr:anaerobic ribonucleoside-triphosphate reductase activating protein [Oscillospiraceae bacterium]
MIFGGFQKLTLLDFPGKVACTLFTIGCNFACPFCHNSFLVEQNGHQSIDEEEILSYLKKRQGVLEGVCISGGEPLLHNELEDFIVKVKELGYKVKLDTNGSFPDKLKKLVKKGLVDYVAMDVKNRLGKYLETSGIENLDVESVKESISFLMTDSVDYEFRTTVVKGLHTVSDILDLSKEIKGAKRYYIQNFVDSGNILGKGLSPVDEITLIKMKQVALENICNTYIRGTDI